MNYQKHTGGDFREKPESSLQILSATITAYNQNEISKKADKFQDGRAKSSTRLEKEPFTTESLHMNDTYVQSTTLHTAPMLITVHLS